MALVPSVRHRDGDWKLWRELEECDHIHGDRLRRSGKIERSIEVIREFAAAGPCYVGSSWGKDSVVVLHLCRLAGMETKIPIVNLRCNNRNPDCDVVRDMYFAANPCGEYREFAVDYSDLHSSGLPHWELDKQTDRLWYAAIRDMGKVYGERHILGIRADESSGRKARMNRWGESSLNGCAPIGWWTTADVFAYLAVNDLPVHPVYAMLGGGRWPRERLRTAEIGDTHGTGGGRREWEMEYYGDELRLLEAGRKAAEGAGAATTGRKAASWLSL